MTIGELKVFKDTHDSHGQRYIETTRSGRLLLQWLKSLLNQRTKYSGTGAETLLGSLNDILVSRKQLSQEETLTVLLKDKKIPRRHKENQNSGRSICGAIANTSF